MIKFNGYKIKNRDVKWFKDKGKLGEYIYSATHPYEIAKRLQWLSEGSLEYHMTVFESPYYGPEGIPEERKLYKRHNICGTLVHIG